MLFSRVVWASSQPLRQQRPKPGHLLYSSSFTPLEFKTCVYNPTEKLVSSVEGKRIMRQRDNRNNERHKPKRSTLLVRAEEYP